MTSSHAYNIRVYYEDTDAGGIVYHSNYLNFAERARTEMLRDCGFEHAKLFHEEGMAFAVRRLNIEYIKPARLDDELVVYTNIVSLSGARIIMKQNVMSKYNVLAEIELELACLSPEGRAIRLPKEVYNILKEEVL